MIKQMPSLKRPQPDSSDADNPGKKLKEADVVTLEDSDEDEDDGVNTRLESLSGIQIQRIETETEEVSVSDKIVNNITDNDKEIVVDDDDTIDINHSRDNETTQDVISDSDEDDDIQVLEQRLAASRQMLGTGRRYLETEKATTSKIKRVVSSKRQSVYIPSQRDEYLKQQQEGEGEDTVQMVTLDISSSSEDDETHDDLKNLRESTESQQDEVPDKIDDIVEIPVPAPDIVNIDSNDSDDDEKQTSSSVDNEPDIEPIRKKSFVKDKMIVRSQREEFLLVGKLNQRTESTDEHKLREDKLGRTEDALNFLHDVESEYKVSSETSPNIPSKSVKLHKTEETNNEDVDEYEDVFQEPNQEEVVETSCEKDIDTSVSSRQQDAAKQESTELEDDESDFSISDDEETGVLDQSASDTRKTVVSLPCPRVNIERLSRKMFDYHQKLIIDYLTRKAQLSAPDVSDEDCSASAEKKIVLEVGNSPQKQSSSLLYRIIATLMKRFATTNELHAVDNINISNQSNYDNHCEVAAKYQRKIVTIRQNVEVDICNLAKNDDDQNDNDDADTDSSDIEDEIESVSKLGKMDRKFFSDSIMCIRRLKNETCSSSAPSSKVLNVLFKTLLLEETNLHVINSAVNYLNHFLFLHCSSASDRVVWLKSSLSALRNLKDEKLFRSFTFVNNQELLLCTEFFKEIIEKVIQNSVFSRSFLLHQDPEPSGDESVGPFMLFQFIVKMLRRDYEIWSLDEKNKSQAEKTLPMIFYLLGGSTRDLLKMMKNTVLKVYKQFLKIDHPLSDVRSLLSICAHLVSHLDFVEDYG